MAVKKIEEGFYRRKPRAVLRRIMDLTLEEIAVYNILIDLMYDTWRPLPDHTPGEHAWIVGWMPGAPQKINPILRRLEEKGLVKRVLIDGHAHLTDAEFEAEYQLVKGPKKSAKPRENSGKVGENLGEVPENLPLLDTQTQQNQHVADTEKSKSKRRNREKEKEQKEKSSDLRTWPGDPAVRSAVAGDVRYGSNWCVSYLDRSTLRDDGAVVAWSDRAFDKLSGCEVLKDLGVAIVPP